MAVGFIGLGNVGRHLARSVLRGGHDLVVHDLDEAAAAELVADGARWAPSIAAVCDEASTVITCLPSPQVIDAVVAGPAGVIESLAGQSGACWIDSSTNDRSETLRLAALAADRGVATLEAPVTGGVHMAARGEITVLVGGEAELVERQRGLLDSLGDPVLHIGGLGAAATIKVITNMLALTHLVAAGEALMLAKRSDLDLATAFEAIRNSSGNSFVHETESQVILNGSYNINFT
ncbi:MAG: NAD(P)-dependent oxidoreductase, partial [Ilumatobacteraceae bacterium]